MVLPVEIDDEEIIDGMIFLLEQELYAAGEEMEGVVFLLGHIGGRLMRMLEDGLEIDDDEFGDAWEPVTVYVEEYRMMNDPSFRMHFRLRKTTFEFLLTTLANYPVDAGRVQRVRNPLDIPLLRTLWILANPDTFRSVALRFGVRPGVVHFHYCYIIEAVREMAPSYIQWPDEDERSRIKARFEAYSGFPGIIGCLDGTYNNVTAPAVQPERFINRHHTYSFNTMVVCDDNLLIRDVHIGEVGSMHDQRVFRRSPLYGRLLHDVNNQYVLPDEHTVADGAYTLSDKVMVPLRNVGNLTQQQQLFNRRLSKCRARIEHTFGKAFGQWRRMKHLHSLNINLAVDHFMACFVLHNFMILSGEQLMDLEDPPAHVPERDYEGDDVDEEDVNGLEEVERNARLRGVQKRQEIVQIM